jgi:hypothetical protein
MRRENTSIYTSYPDINDLLVTWKQDVCSVLGENVIGLYLTGSLTYGDFVPDRSDIDLQVVVHRALDQVELALIEQLHQRLEKHYPAWKNRVECSYVPLTMMSEILPPQAPRPWWGFGTFYAEALAGNEWIINHYFLSKYGVVLFGPNFNTLIPPLDTSDVRKASARDLFKEWEPKIRDREWLANPHYQSYLVLNICRIVHTVIGEGPSSKKVAAQWVRSYYPQWSTLVDEATRWVYGMPMNHQDEVVRFVRWAIEIVKEKGFGYRG